MAMGLGFLIGICSLFFIQNEQQAVSTVFVSIISIFSCVYFRLKNILMFLLSGLFVASLAVVLWHQYFRLSLDKPITTVLLGTICNIPKADNERLEFDLCVEKIEDKKLQWFQWNKVQVRWSQYASLPTQLPRAGEVWQLEVKLSPPHSKLNWNGHDTLRWMVANHYLGSATAKGGELVTSDAQDLKSYLLQHRQLLYQRILKVFDQQGQYGLLVAMTLGEKLDVSEEQLALFRNTGTSHLLAISGLHVGIAALWFYWLFSYLWRSSIRLLLMVPAFIVGQIASAIGALWVVLLSGAELPALRAFIMLIVFLISLSAGRYLKLSRSLSLAMIIILLSDPFAILSPSFWLSFIAVAVIALVVSREHQPVSKLIGWLHINWFLYLAMVPIGLVFFGSFSLVSILANLVLIPLVSFVIAPLCYLFIFSISILGEAYWALIEINNILFDLVLWYQSIIQTIPYSTIQFTLSLPVLGLIIGMLLVLISPKKLIANVLLLPTAFVALLSTFQTFPQPPLTIYVFDIGQGLAVLVETDGKRLLYDTGWGNSQYAIANNTILPYLKGKQINTLDKLVISHSDSDHSGGLSVIEKQMVVEQIVSGEKLIGKNVKNCHGQSPWSWGDVKFQFLKHLNSESAKTNNRSCVLSISYKNQSVLIPGDIEKLAEQALIANGLEPHQLVIAPHHGSRTSSTLEFVKALSPKEVIFSTGYGNQWGFPKKDVVERYHQVGAKTWITHITGGILIRFSESGSYELAGEKQITPHFWLTH